MDALAFQSVVVVQPACVDKSDIALAVLGDDFFGTGPRLVGELGEVGARLGEWHNVTG
ncbi:hypothetical protein D3C85_1898840 [compost metagenome]